MISVKILQSTKEPVSGSPVFEYIDCNVKIGKALSRPPPSIVNKNTTNSFLDAWPMFLNKYAVTSKEVIIVGDLNLHLDKKDNLESRRFMSSLEECGLCQHVQEPTHAHGHILLLDVLIIRNTSTVIPNVTIMEPGLGGNDGKLPRDHFAVTFNVSIKKPSHIGKHVSFCCIGNINEDEFRKDTILSPITKLLGIPSISADDLVKDYN